MFVVIAIILGILIGFIRGGSFGGFRVKKISLLPLGIIGIVLQLVLHLYYYTGGIEAIDAFLPVVNFISYILILVMLVFNLDDFWTIMIAVGLTANFIVTFINGGKMPVATKIVESLPQASAFATSINEGSSAIYAVMQQSGLWVLGVNIPIPFVSGIMQYFGSIGGFSIGSAVVFIGLIGWVQYAMKRKKSAFSKDEPIGELDYIIPPDTEDEDDDDDFFSDYDDEDNDFYPEEDFSDDSIENLEVSFENMNGGLTDVIPKLTPEAIAAMQDNGEGLGRSILDEYDPSQDTKVFTTIRDIGNHETPEIKETVRDVEDTGPISGFFTQSFYAEKEKGKLAFEKEESIIAEKPEEIIPEERIIIQEPVAVAVEIPQAPQAPIAVTPVPVVAPVKPEIMEKTPFVVENNKIVSNPEYEEPMINNKEERTEADMLNVWQQLNQEQEKVRARKRRRANYVNVKEPFKAEREKVAAEKAVVRAQAVVKAQALSETEPVYRQIMPEQEEAVQPAPVTAAPAVSATAAPAQSFITPPIVPVQEAVVKAAPVETPKVQTVSEQSTAGASGTLSDEEREKAGYEKVKLSVEGRDVVFWRKKKD